MYFNDIHILYYVLFGVMGLMIGQFMDWVNYRLSEHKKVFSKEIFSEYHKKFKPNYLLMLANAALYIFLLYHFGFQDTLIKNLDLIQYLTLTPMLLSVIVIDLKKQIVPNRLVLTIFEVGLFFTFAYGISDINIAMTRLIGGIISTLIFLVITLIGGLISGKDSMGFGDVKLIGALGLYFGLSNMIAICVMSFLIGAIISIILILIRVKKTDEYIPFGPFIAISTFISMFVPFGTIMLVLLKVFTLGLYKM